MFEASSHLSLTGKLVLIVPCRPQDPCLSPTAAANSAVVLPHSGAYFRLFGLHIDTGMPAAYTDEHWRSVLAQVNLSHEQVCST